MKLIKRTHAFLWESEYFVGMNIFIEDFADEKQNTQLHWEWNDLLEVDIYILVFDIHDDDEQKLENMSFNGWL